MKNNKLGTFIEKTYKWGKKLILLESSQTVPCTSEEKRIYGVDFKLEEELSKFEIAIFPFEDGGVYYKAIIKEFGYEPDHYFKDLDKCKEFLIKEAQERREAQEREAQEREAREREAQERREAREKKLT